MKSRQTNPSVAAGRLSFFILLLVGLTGCLPSIMATSDFDRSANFEVYRTFALLEPEAAGAGADPAAFEPLLDRRVRESIASEMVKKGIQPDAQNPGLLIAYDVSVAQAPNVSGGTDATGYSYWYGYRYNYGTGGVPGYQGIGAYPVGTLVIDLIDATTNELVWRGYAEGDIDAGLTEESKIRRAIAGILAQYPPGQVR